MGPTLKPCSLKFIFQFWISKDFLVYIKLARNRKIRQSFSRDPKLEEIDKPSAIKKM